MQPIIIALKIFFFLKNCLRNKNLPQESTVVKLSVKRNKFF